MNNNFYLLKVSIGPVQEFIKEARKIKDLWFGSSLLSRITYEALRPFIDNKCEIIFPNPKSFENTGSLPNHFLVKVPRTDFDTLIKNSQDGINGFWMTVAQDIRKSIKGDFDKFSNNWDAKWDSQINDFWEYYWVAIPVDDTDYGTKARRVQKFLDERKLTRTFNQWQGSPAEKCTQCGRREVLGPLVQSENREFWNEIKKDNKYKYVFKKGDRLCAICTIKRLLKADDLNKNLSQIIFKEPEYESTRDIAVKPFVKEIELKCNEQLKNEFIENCKQLASQLSININNGIESIPSIFFYKDELNPKSLVKEFFPELYLDKTNHEKAQKKEAEIKTEADNVRETLSKIEEELKTEPTKYYSIVAMDGDKIGEWLYDINSKNEQTDKSNKLSKMAKIMAKIDDSKWQGRYIYAGGDDLLAFGPLEKTLKTCARIRRIFHKCVGQTISAGIVITHYSNPLRKDLEMARENLEKAKEEMDRDALAITIHLSSENIIEFRSKWDIIVNGCSKSLIELIAEFLSFFTSQKLKIGFIFDLIKALPACYWLDSHGKHFTKEIFEPEALRLYKRHRPSFNELPQHQRDTEISQLKAIIDFLTKLADPKIDNNVRDSWKKHVDTEENIINLLRIVAFLIRENIKEI
ncbi:MAG: type III-B CRISPR-associated protein Cas10/Cmr2 [candidate division WOR-3 bacterium]